MIEWMMNSNLEDFMSIIFIPFSFIILFRIVQYKVV